ncbi:hydroxymethylglutaryl-CoA synthase [Salinibius halmophilus]|uniref:hydroxymethylglutaryl-CoA synthase n=1 Tax=Salinibius halmophilus TaxID=1853216 RepID=UPI000E6632F5|nr:hydroxymethylglutaryl-CoA synthase [Salinibius halmophilus]
MVRVGIDRIAFYTSNQFVALKDVAEHNQIDPDKFALGIWQENMAVASVDEDAVTLAANAAETIFADGSIARQVDQLLFATESGVDQSKAGGVYIRRLLGLNQNCRVVELKQACYSATAGLQMALAQIRANPSLRILLIASDIARYGLGTPGEATQGCGAVAMLLTANPSILAIDEVAGLHSDDVMDFWRPNYSDTALVDGKYSTKVYLNTLKACIADYQARGGELEFQHLCYHLPFSRMAEKAHKTFCRESGNRYQVEAFEQNIAAGLIYNRTIGNSYTASLYIALASLLDNQEVEANARIGLFSFGSGCMGELMSATVVAGYRDALYSKAHHQMLSERTQMTYADYEAAFTYGYVVDGSEQVLPKQTTGAYRLAKIDQHQRHYEPTNC